MSCIYVLLFTISVVLALVVWFFFEFSLRSFKKSVINSVICLYFSILVFSPVFIEYDKDSDSFHLSEFNNFSFSNSKVAGFTGKTIDSYDNLFVFCYEDCLNYPASLSVYYDSIEEEKVLNLKFEMIKPIVFLEKNILNSDKEYELPIDGYVISRVYAGVVKSILSKYLSEHYNQSEEESRFEFLFSKQKELNELFFVEGLKIEKISVN